ncbi:gibberellic acid methyltransferase 1-like isoform X1 [Mizuhopecten yessoensis]|uniref:Indole-3-acetate O-methyltransferase 1 n=1 Tax=Mizuhopecten yessoensis TaxID=6573 RepID=A0A210R0Y7_MIZYE|nr:gibberellic acid methyltransferase 1-like isoform X1 [Mizuhopecten yessoensis]OWF54690.1 Indole-3-acetate O-methyltransferase 1 [Mizuhopecten yessoensis]
MTSQRDHLGSVYNGEECYSSAMDNSRKVLRTFTENLLQCVDNLLKQEDKNSRTICIAEFGAADGGVSLELMDTVIDNIHQMSSDQREVILVYEDQLLNDYNVLFQTVHAKDSNISTKLSTRDQVHVLASATTMYRKCLPTGFVDLAFSSMANHWLSQRPCPIRGGLFQSDCDMEELEAFRHQWQTDWIQFLSCRSLELRPGGYMMVISFVFNDNGQKKAVEEDLHDVYTKTWKEFWQNGKITEEEFVSSSSFTYKPTMAELLQPFNTDMKGSLSLVEFTQKDVEVIPGVERGAGSDDLEVFVDKTLRYAKPWLYNILKAGLSPGRKEAEKCRIFDDYFQTLRGILLQRTTFCPLVYKIACVIAKRTCL